MPSVKYPQLNDPEWILEQEEIHGGQTRAARFHKVEITSWRLQSPKTREADLKRLRKYEQTSPKRKITHSAGGRRRYYLRRDAGICVKCKKPLLSEVYCWDCLNKKSGL